MVNARARVWAIKGPEGVYELLKAKLVDLDPQTLISGAINSVTEWLTVNVIKNVTQKVTGLLATAGVSDALMAIFDFVDWLFDRIDNLKGVVE